MKRTCKNNINRNNTTLYNHMRNNLPRNNTVTPELLPYQIWVQEEDTCGVKITELNSSNSSKESPRNFNHVWSYISNDRYQDIQGVEVEEIEQDDYIVNEAARCRRRTDFNKDGNMYVPLYSNQYYLDRNIQSHSNTCYDYDASAMNHQMNCFTIINNQHVNSDSSTDNENYEAVEIIEVDNSDKTKYWDHVYNEEVITYDPNTQSEKRTIWIYSYKNKRLLSDNDFELVNIPSKDTTDSSTSCPTSDEEQKVDKCTNSRRISSPIPASYVVPRLDLSLVQTLSTVTEISEPNKSQSKNSLREMINLKQRNNWFSERTDKTKKEHCSTIVDWMALSPRERRRRSINTNLDITTKEDVKGTEVTYAEGSTQLDQNAIKSSRVESSTVQVHVDIHANENEPRKEAYTWTTAKGDASADVIKNIAHTCTLPIDLSISEEESDKIELDFSNIPSIQINTKPARTIITDPIEHLHSETWIAEEQMEKETTVYDLENADFNDKYSTAEIDFNVASNRLWKKNLQLMKPPEWAEYLPIASSPPSLHLSISLMSLNAKKPWFKRLKNYITCCK